MATKKNDQEQSEHRDAGAINPHEIPEGSERNPADVVNPNSPYNQAKREAEAPARK
jgi:hypothetical protein